jgi:murein L,D-transpeptidase YafK
MRKYIWVVFMFSAMALNGQDSSIVVQDTSVVVQDTSIPFVDSMLTYYRVQKAKKITNTKVQKMFESKGLQFPPKDIYWRGFKYEDELELWARDSTNEPYQHLKTYHICKGSGTHGPKRMRGDKQVPEGFYHIELFNPYSLFWLSFKVSYPNRSDSILGYKSKLGGDIYVHGNCMTIGCLPMTDSLINEIFWTSVLCQNEIGDSAKIPIHLFPIKMTDANMLILKKEFGRDYRRMSFWKNIKTGFKYFEENRVIPVIEVNDKGKYIYHVPIIQTKADTN